MTTYIEIGDAEQYILVLHYHDNSAMLDSYGPFSSRELAEQAQQLMPEAMTFGAGWTVLPLHRVRASEPFLNEDAEL